MIGANIMKKFRDDLYTYAGFENITENIVLEELDYFINDNENMKSKEFCKCWICVADVAAIILNELKPDYCSNFIDKDQKNDYSEKLRKQVFELIIKAFEKVQKNPHHKI